MKSYKFNEPIKGQEFRFSLIERSKLKNSPYQRDFSSTLVNRLVNSVYRGFLMPLLVVEDGKFFRVIDGQHRLGALDKAIVDDDPLVPCIILPHEFQDTPLFYNIEKTDNIKDKSRKLYRLYLDKLNKGLNERDILPAANYEPYLFTIAFAYCEHGLKSPSLVESPVKKLDNVELTVSDDSGYPVGMPLEESVEIRRANGALAVQLEQTVEQICKDYAVTDFNLKRSIVSQSSQALWGKKRKVGETMETGMPALIEQMEMMDWSWMGGR